jgi:hypothetical protein
VGTGAPLGDPVSGFVLCSPVPFRAFLELPSAPHGTVLHVKSASLDDAQLNRLWGAVCAFAGIFLLLWVLSFINATVLNEDLQNRCGDLHTDRFPFEKSCRHEDGTVEGANSLIFEGTFFTSLAASAVCLGAALVIEGVRRK